MASPAHSPRRLVILTGAGVSRESGLHTFRDPDGIWAQVRIEDVATPEAFAKDPTRVNEFYNQRRRGLLVDTIQPNAAHRALAQLEAAWQGEFLLVTQNIDNLHERAGSSREGLIHMHGELLQSRCAGCGNTFVCRDDLTVQTRCSTCGKLGGMRPDVVWFGEVPHHMDRIYTALEQCEIFGAIGTSGQVYPAAQFVDAAAAAGAHTLELNLEPSDTNSLFAEHHHGPATQVVPAWVERLLSPD